MSAIWEDPIGNAKEEFEREQEKKLASQKVEAQQEISLEHQSSQNASLEASSEAF